MSGADPSKTLAEVQRQRDAARAKLRGDVATLRGDLAERSIPARIGDRATEVALEGMETAKDVASENKIVVGLTIAGLLGWFLRSPILLLVGSRKPEISGKWWPFAKLKKD
jgi:hypothetical protein